MFRTNLIFNRIFLFFTVACFLTPEAKGIESKEELFSKNTYKKWDQITKKSLESKNILKLFKNFSFSKKDQVFLKKYMVKHDIKKLAAVIRDKNLFIIGSGSHAAKLLVLKKDAFSLNGYEYTYRPSDSLEKRVKYLSQILKKTKTSSLLKLFFGPKAYADAEYDNTPLTSITLAWYESLLAGREHSFREALVSLSKSRELNHSAELTCTDAGGFKLEVANNESNYYLTGSFNSKDTTSIKQSKEYTPELHERNSRLSRGRMTNYFNYQLNVTHKVPHLKAEFKSTYYQQLNKPEGDEALKYLNENIHSSELEGLQFFEGLVVSNKDSTFCRSKEDGDVSVQDNTNKCRAYTSSVDFKKTAQNIQKVAEKSSISSGWNEYSKKQLQKLKAETSYGNSTLQPLSKEPQRSLFLKLVEISSDCCSGEDSKECSSKINEKSEYTKVFNRKAYQKGSI